MTLKKATVRLVKERDKGCVFCARSETHLHHITYRSRGGKDEDWNLISVCATHHEWVHKINYPEWLLHLVARSARPLPIVLYALDTNPPLRAAPGTLREQVRCCLSCDRRDETGVCTLWEHNVDWDYSCDYWVCRPLPVAPG